MTMRFVCPKCGYGYRRRSQNSCCPRCKTVLSNEEIQSQAIFYIVGMIICLIVVAAMSAK